MLISSTTTTNEVAKSLYPRFSQGEIRRRRRAVKEYMERNQIDCLILAGSSSRWNEKYSNIRYLSEFVDKESPCSYLIFPLDDEPTLLIWSVVRLQNARLMSDIRDIRPVHPDYAGAIVRRLEELKLRSGRIGIEGFDRFLEIPANHLRELKNRVPGAHFESVNLVERLRLVKSEEEIQFMREASRLSDLAVENMLATAKPGMTDYQVYADIDRTMAYNGGEAPFLTLVGSTSMTNPSMPFPNITPSGRKIRRGDMILTEITGKYGGYWGQTHRPLSFGKPPARIARMFEVAKEVYDIVVSELRPGNSLQSVMKAGQGVLENKGLTWIAPFAHGIGMEAPEEPVLGIGHWPLDPIVIEEGMCFSVEPNPTTKDKRIGAFLGDTFVVKKNGSERLNKFPVQLSVA
jgi:Xaa-Pro aminopeptidase